MDGGLVGRESLLRDTWQEIDQSRSVLLQGPAGIGKTAVWRELVSRAEQQRWRVLTAAPTEPEHTLPYAGLADLLAPLAAAVPDLPAPQRTAAEVVLLSAETSEPLDERAVAAATRSLLAVAGADRRLLVAVDDLPWLDPPSERALRFALRRSPAVPLLVTHRRDPPAPADPLGRADLTVRAVEPLAVAAVSRMLRDRLEHPLHRPVLARIGRESGGNPLLAIELARAVSRLPQPPRLADDLPVAASLQQLVAQTLAALPAPSREATRLAALLTVPRLAALADAGVPAAEFEPAEEAGLLTVTGTAVEFAHPVYANAVRAQIPPGVRRRLHRQLAVAALDSDERARHLAAGTTEPDALVAEALAAAARRQRDRGGPEHAGELYERAAELSPTAVAGWPHRLAAARCRFDSGDYQGTAVVAAGLVESAATGEQRAEALLLRAMVIWGSVESNLGEAVALAGEALAATDPGSRLAGRIYAHLATFEDDPDVASGHAAAAAKLLADVVDQPGPVDPEERQLLCAALLLQHHHEVRAGRPPGDELLERGMALEDGRPSWLAGTVPAIWWKGIDDHDRARARLRELLGWAEAYGDEPWQQEALNHLAETELLAGRWDAAAEHVAAAWALGEQTGSGLISEAWLAGMVAAHRGELAEAEAAAATGLRRAAEYDDRWCRRINLHLSGFVALSAGRLADAAAAYTELAARCDELGLAESLALRFEPDWIEACLGAGDVATARRGLARLAARHARLPRPWTRLGLARGEVLLASATGEDPAEPLARLAEVLATTPAEVVPFDQARGWLVAGMAHRRARRKRVAREALIAAATGFEALGAAAYAARAHAELARVGGRPPAPPGLTVTEERVAGLAAQGRTNREIAAELFLSPKTVEANLARIYRKLGVGNRAQLAAAMASQLPAPG